MIIRRRKLPSLQPSAAIANNPMAPNDRNWTLPLKSPAAYGRPRLRRMQIACPIATFYTAPPYLSGYQTPPSSLPAYLQGRTH